MGVCDGDGGVFWVLDKRIFKIWFNRFGSFIFLSITSLGFILIFGWLLSRSQSLFFGVVPPVRKDLRGPRKSWVRDKLVTNVRK